MLLEACPIPILPKYAGRHRTVTEPATPSITLLARVARGDEDAVSACMDRFGGLVWSLARRYLRNDAEAADAVQEIFIELWQNAKRYDPERGSEETFVAVLTRRRLIDRLRKLKRQPRAASLAAAAEVVRGKKVAEDVELYIAAASTEVQAESERRGDWQALVQAGARTLPPGCGPCIGLGTGLLEDGEVGISATNRNFKGRMGSRSAEAYLASPAVVAASAIAGRIAGPANYDNVVAIGLGTQFSCAVRNDGTMWCWGRGDIGQLGNGSSSNSSTPVQVSNLSNGAGVDGGGDQTCAALNDGSAMCWGDNTAGALGDGTTTSSNVPVQVVGF